MPNDDFDQEAVFTSRQEARLRGMIERIILDLVVPKIVNVVESARERALEAGPRAINETFDLLVASLRDQLK